jgi:cytochrome P450
MAELNLLAEDFPWSATKQLTEHVAKHSHFKEYTSRGAILHVFSYRMSREILRNHNLWSSNIPEVEEMLLADAAVLIQDDPPAHTLIRKQLNPWFANRVTDLKRTIAHDTTLSIRKRSGDSFDAVSYGKKVRDHLMQILFGFSKQTMERIETWAEEFEAGIGAEFIEDSTERAVTQKQFVREKHKALDDIIHQALRQTNAQLTDLRKYLEHPEDQTSRLLSVLKMLIFGSITTISSQVTNIFLGLSELDPEGQINVAKSMSKRGLVAETLRLHPVFRGSQRVARRSHDFYNFEITASDRCIVWHTAANRDPEVFVSPNKIDPRNRSAEHLSFGSGIHRCIGAALATIALERTAQEVLDDYAPMEIERHVPSSDPWVDSPAILEVKFSAD